MLIQTRSNATNMFAKFGWKTRVRQTIDKIRKKFVFYWNNATVFIESMAGVDIENWQTNNYSLSESSLAIAFSIFL